VQARSLFFSGRRVDLFSDPPEAVEGDQRLQVAGDMRQARVSADSPLVPRHPRAWRAAARPAGALAPDLLAPALQVSWLRAPAVTGS